MKAEAMIITVIVIGLIILIIKIKECSNNTSYDAWLEEDKAKYPDLY